MLKKNEEAAEQSRPEDCALHLRTCSPVPEHKNRSQKSIWCPPRSFSAWSFEAEFPTECGAHELVYAAWTASLSPIMWILDI